MIERATITTREHSDCLQGQVTFMNSAIDIVRKQLTGHGAVISNLAEATKRRKKEIDAVANWIVRFSVQVLVTSVKISTTLINLQNDCADVVFIDIYLRMSSLRNKPRGE